MSEMNIGQFVNRFLNFATGTNSGAKAGSSGFETATKVAQEAVNIVRSAASNSNAIQQQIYQETMQMARMNTLERCLVLQELFSLPKDIKEFLMMMSNSSATQMLTTSDLTNLLLAQNIDVSKLLAYMQQNGKEALSKLFQMVANYNQLGSALKSSDMKELTKLINACIPGASNPDNSAIKNTMLLYLPWFSLNGAVEFDLNVSAAKVKNGEDSDDSVTILISTQNFGNIQVSLFKVSKEEVNIQITSSDEFPAKAFKEELGSISNDYRVGIKMFFDTQENFAKNSLKIEKPQVTMSTTPGTNSFLILLAQIVIKVVVELDKKATLVNLRKEKLEK